MMDPNQMQHAFEQGSVSLTNLAKLLGDYFNQLIKEGFTRDEAMDLVLDYQSFIFGRPNAST